MSRHLPARRSRHLRAVGLLLVFGLVAGGCSPFGTGGYEIQAEFTRTYNLFPGSPVRVLGIDAGKVSRVDVEPGSEVVTVTLLLQERIEVPADATATIVPESLLGERYIQIEPPYTSGATLSAGDVIPAERTMVPFEFDEVLENLNQFVGGLEESEVGRMFANLADVLEGNGAELGESIDAAHEAIAVLEANDEQLVALASRLADLNETLATRDEEMGQLIEDWSTLTGSLVDDRRDIDAALSGLVRVTRNLGDVLETHRGDLEEDIQTLTRVGRTANRNLDQISLLVLGSAELFRHAERIVDRDERNWLPLLNIAGERFEEALADSIVNRLEGLCLGAGFSREECEDMALDELIGDEVCFPPLVACPEDQQTRTFAEAMRSVAREEPELAEALVEHDQRDDAGTDDSEDDADTDSGLLDGIGGLLGGEDGR